MQLLIIKNKKIKITELLNLLNKKNTMNILKFINNIMMITVIIGCSY